MTAPYSDSTYLTNLAWETLGNVQQLANGADCWPITWAEDGKQYTAYGDGFGFNQAESSKLSMGFSTVENGPTALTESDPGSGGDCQNINSNDEETGDGQSGKKPSGIVAIGSYLWLWVRNADQAGNDVELWYSSNDGVDWTDCGWDMSLSTMSFVNHGQGNDNVKNGYVYAICANTDDAYDVADELVLLRCAVTGNGTEMATQGNWEYFSGTDESPAWSSTFGDRTAIFSYSGKCNRQQMVYCEPVRRYLLWQRHVQADTRNNDGEWGIYESENPYGPWKTVVHYESGDYWDMYPGETGSFPCAWMDLDGTTLTLYLVCSADDYFTVRKATISISSGDGGGGGTMILDTEYSLYSDIIAAYPFDEGSGEPGDLKGGSDLTRNGNCDWGGGDPESIDNPGAQADYLSFGTDYIESLFDGLAGVSILLRFKLDAIDATDFENCLWDWYLESGTNCAILRVASDGDPIVQARGSAGDGSRVLTCDLTSKVQANTVHDILIIYDYTNHMIYCYLDADDNSDSASVSFSETTFTASATASSYPDSVLGSNRSGRFVDQGGEVYNFVVFDKVLSSGEITTLFSDPLAMYAAAGGTKALAGTIAVTSSFISAPLLRLRPVASSLESVSSFSASPLNRSRLFSGSLAASSAIAASPLNRLRQLTGSFAAVSAFSGALSKTAAAVIKALAGTIAAISSFTAQPLRRSRIIQGSSAASSTFTASPLNRLRNILGSFAAVSTFAAAPLQRLRRFTGSFAAASSFASNPLKRLRLFAGSFAGVSTFEGALSKVSAGVKALAGSIAAVSSIAGQALKRSRKIDGNISATSDLSSGPLQRARSLKGDFAAVSSLVGSLTGGAAAVIKKIGGLLLRGVGN